MPYFSLDDAKIGNWLKKYRRLFSPKVTEGAKIIVGRKEEREPLDTTELLKEVASITASMMTILILMRSIQKVGP